MAKIGVNSDNSPIKCPGTNFIIIDNHFLNAKGVLNLCNNLNHLYLVTMNPTHPAKELMLNNPKLNLTVIEYEEEIDFKDLFENLRNEYGVERITIQSGGTLNAEFVRMGLIDEIKLVIAPCLIGGKDTASLIGGKSLSRDEDLQQIKSMQLLECRKLEDNYILLRYKINN